LRAICFLSCFFCCYRYFRFDPLNRAFGFISALLLTCASVYSCTPFWLPYFIGLLFLRGILVVLITITTLSKPEFRSVPLQFTRFGLASFFTVSGLNSLESRLSRYYTIVYLNLFSWVFFLVVFCLIYSYIQINYVGALRSL